MVMVRARLARVALLAALGVASGCSTPSSCTSCSDSSITTRLTSLFRRNRATTTEVIGPTVEGPVLVDPGVLPENPGFAPMPQSIAPPLIPPPQPLQNGEARRMPYQPPG